MNTMIPMPVQTTVKAKPRRKRKSATGLPYASAASGNRAREEATKWLRRLGCEQIGFMDDFQAQELLLAFTHRGRHVQLRASAKGWAQKWLKENPQGYRSRSSPDEYKRAALHQGQIAVSSIIRDWVKGSVMAVESGVFSFEAAFLPHMLTSDGRPIIERGRELLPAPTEEKIVSLQAS